MRRMISIVCAEQSDIDSVLLKTELSDIEGYHLDIVSKDIDAIGNFKNQLFIDICKNSKKVKELHMLLDDVFHCIHSICALKPDYIYISSQSRNIDKIFEITHKNGIKLGIYFESGSEIEDGELEKFLQYSVNFMILTVEPQSIGGKWLPYAEKNINSILNTEKHIELELDGACSKEVIDYYSGIGVNAFVLGTKSGYFDGFRVRKGKF